MQKERLASAALVAFVAFQLAGCGGSSSGGAAKTAASSYVHTFCTAISAVEQTEKSGAASLNKQSAVTQKQRQQLKTQLMHYFNSESQAAADARAKIDKAGTPDVAGGPKIRAALLDAFQKFGAGFDMAARQSGALNTADQHAFAESVQQLETQLQKTSQGVSSSLNGLGDSLKSAASKDPACSAIA